MALEADGSCTVRDNGRGIPVGLHKKGVSAERVVLSTLHAGGKFDNDSYKMHLLMRSSIISSVCGAKTIPCGTQALPVVYPL